MEWRRIRVPGVRHPNGMAAHKGSGCETSRWNVGIEGFSGVRHPDGNGSREGFRMRDTRMEMAEKDFRV